MVHDRFILPTLRADNCRSFRNSQRRLNIQCSSSTSLQGLQLALGYHSVYCDTDMSNAMIRSIVPETLRNIGTYHRWVHPHGFEYCSTMLNRLSHWLEAILSRSNKLKQPLVFSTRSDITLWKTFGHQDLQGIKIRVVLILVRTIPYHPACDEVIEHRILKSVIMCHTILLSLQNSLKEYLGASPVELFDGAILRLSGEWLDDTITGECNIHSFLQTIEEGPLFVFRRIPSKWTPPKSH